MIKLMLVDDHAIVRDGVRLLLEQGDGIDIIDEANDGEEALEKLKKHQTDGTLPDVLLLDISMPGMSGIQTAQQVARSYKNVKILMLSMHNNEDYILRAVEAGALGYILKDSSSDEMMKAIKTVATGEKYFSSPVATIILNGYMQQMRKDPNATVGKTRRSKLSKKEKEILSYLIEGLSSRLIAEKLQLSVRTVDNHRANMMRRLQVRNAAELVRMAVEDKLV
ncbi:two component transcriptional regulator, LuxR family [Fibrella aestuarina BUZ 2]|uniref:Two component transcriptional regulator, LuxR family n=2 Tax=Spirosomataceae TaxID=2896860 RepID=I0K6I4_9BACT|nr:two component transcriptional regulator, LuxR family [Fibrella aestuarina BUZ 2]